MCVLECGAYWRGATIRFPRHGWSVPLWYQWRAIDKLSATGQGANGIVRPHRYVCLQVPELCTISLSLEEVSGTWPGKVLATF